MSVTSAKAKPLINYGTVVVCVIIAQFLIGTAVMYSVKYTEIDWKAYMQEVEGVINGEMNYTNLRGDTGPLVYPAGFVWIYAALYYITDLGRNIFVGQGIFVLLHTLLVAVVALIYKEVAPQINFPKWAFILLVASRRVQSIFVLRLFNDCWAMLFLYLAVYAFIKKRWTFGSLLISVALSIKMNILLFMPPLAVILVKELGYIKAFFNLIVIFVFQAAVAIPFLTTYPSEYFHMAFDFSRQFFYIWSVNWKMIDEEVFLSKDFGNILLGAHLSLLVIFGVKWCSQEGGVFATLFNRHHYSLKPYSISPAHLVALLFTGNFIGIACSRSLHYQFYVWYYHTLPFLLWTIPIPVVLRLIILALIEVCWNVFPSVPWSSSLLLGCHVVMLIGLLFTRPPLAKPSQITNDKIHLARKKR